MYSTCLFCKANLGRNEALEEFPIGRRVAFDLSRGRLWVVCSSCERWNLSPLEERWEVIESCERLFQDTRLRVSTENIGLARLKEGAELVRIGSPQRPEMAAWRYGDQFGRRRRRALVTAGAGLGALAAVFAGGAAMGVGLGAVGTYGILVDRIVHGNPKRVIATLPGEGGATLKLYRKDANKVRLKASGGKGEWRLTLRLEKHDVEYAGDAAIQACATVLPTLNKFGGTRRHVTSAVDFLEQSGDVQATFRNAAASLVGGAGRPLYRLPYDVRLAMEMAAHEEAERRALEGELAELERAWRDAEEIAEISDRLLMPASFDEWIRRVRGA